MATDSIEASRPGRLARTGHILWHEFLQVLPPTIFFFFGFNLILLTKRLILAEYLIQFTGFFIATAAALVVGKVVLVVDKMPFLRRFDYAPLAQPILFKTAIYTGVVFLVRLVEAFVRYAAEGGIIGGGHFVEHVLGTFSWHRFIATQLWVFVLFLVYVAASEINNLLGDGELFKILFTRRSSELKSTRRARIRLLVRLARLTEAHSVDILANPATRQHAELTGILRSLAEDGRSR